MDTHVTLCAEWQTLQNNHEQHERHAVFIKLTCVSLFVAGLATHVSLAWLAAVVSLLWLQEGIIKTYQRRLGDRLLRLEALLMRSPAEHSGMQLHTEWEKFRPSTSALLTSYARSALRPTVAYPYVPLLLSIACFKVYQHYG